MGGCVGPFAASLADTNKIGKKEKVLSARGGRGGTREWLHGVDSKRGLTLGRRRIPGSGGGVDTTLLPFSSWHKRTRFITIPFPWFALGAENG